ncbi:MoaD/ThiS family protein [Thalassolituus maritimus]|uniref:Molybdopterin synthase sulfur carrier subunit n=1 Tax=Thalassolituus maritimus TaxID=484498 RepID=A0ABP9ZX79_9GAMM
MIRVYFFAKIKDELNMDFYDLDIKFPCSVSDLRNSLSSKLKNDELFSSDYAICAVNHEISNSEKIVKESDEVAFFPPVTGG